MEINHYLKQKKLQKNWLRSCTFSVIFILKVPYKYICIAATQCSRSTFCTLHSPKIHWLLTTAKKVRLATLTLNYTTLMRSNYCMHRLKSKLNSISIAPDLVNLHFIVYIMRYQTFCQTHSIQKKILPGHKKSNSHFYP